MVSWEDMAGLLGLDRAKKREIEHIKIYREQKKECVEEWREQRGEKATYSAFIEAAREAELNGLADKVKTMLWEREATAEGGLILQACLYMYTCNNRQRLTTMLK